jgi:integrase
MSPRRRNAENRGLPARWRFYNGAYRYQVPRGLEHLWDGRRQFTLGRTLAEAYDTWRKRIAPTPSERRTVGDILDRYALEVVPTKAESTRDDNVAAIARLKAVFGAMPKGAIEPHQVYKYVDRRKRKDGTPARTAAHREIEVLSHAMTKAVEWGDIKAHPFAGEVRLDGERALRPRTRYVEDWEIVEALALPVSKFGRKRSGLRMLQAYIRLKLLTGMRKGDLLRLRMADARADGIHYVASKTKRSDGREKVIEWSDELRAAWDACAACRPVDIAPLLFCKERRGSTAGESFVNSKGKTPAFNSLWQRFMKKLLAAGVVSQRFTEHDLRAKAGSDAESLERARQLLGHADAKMTQKTYRRAPEKVRPLR